MSIDDPNATAKNLAQTTGEQGALSTDSPSDPLTRILAERAAAEHGLIGGLRRAALAAERIKELSSKDEGEDLKRSRERDEAPPSGPRSSTPLPPPFAITSSGQIILNVDACPNLKLEGRTIFCGLVLSEEEAAYATRRIDDAVHEAASHLGGMLRSREPNGSGGHDHK